MVLCSTAICIEALTGAVRFAMVLAAHFSAQAPHHDDETGLFPSIRADDQQQSKESLWSQLWSSGKELCLCAGAPDEPLVHAPRTVVTQLINHRPRAQQVVASCGDSADNIEGEDSVTASARAECEDASGVPCQHSEDNPIGAEVTSAVGLERAASSDAAARQPTPGLEDEVADEGFRELKSMLAEDVWCWCEREWQRSLMNISATLPASPGKTHATTAAAPAAAAASKADWGRVILEAKLSCRDGAGVDVDLEQRSLQIYLHQSELDAARSFLEEENSLAPRLVRRYLEPLSSWLRVHMEVAPPEIAFGTHHVEGDLEEIVCWYSHRRSITG